MRLAKPNRLRVFPIYSPLNFIELVHQLLQRIELIFRQTRRFKASVQPISPVFNKRNLRSTLDNSRTHNPADMHDVTLDNWIHLRAPESLNARSYGALNASLLKTYTIESLNAILLS
jgi:hypothetical protein